MADKLSATDGYRQLRGRPLRFRVRHLLYIMMAVCAALGIPGLAYIAAMIIGPWLLIAPLILVQFLFVLLIPPLRRRLLRRADNPP